MDVEARMYREGGLCLKRKRHAYVPGGYPQVPAAVNQDHDFPVVELVGRTIRVLRVRCPRKCLALETRRETGFAGCGVTCA